MLDRWRIVMNQKKKRRLYCERSCRCVGAAAANGHP